MARIADPDKLKRIKNAVMELLVDHGYGGMSIASVSEKAGVSPGYLYMHYSGKEEMIRELVDAVMANILENFNTHIVNSDSIFDAAYQTIYDLFMLANSQPSVAKFAATVIMDVNIPTRQRDKKYDNLLKLAEDLIKRGIKNKEINPQTTAMEVITVSLPIPFNYIRHCLAQDSQKKFTQEEAKRIAEICLKALS